MKPSAREYARAADLGAQARRNSKKADDNPWRHAENEYDRLLRDSWADGFHEADVERKR